MVIFYNFKRRYHEILRKNKNDNFIITAILFKYLIQFETKSIQFSIQDIRFQRVPQGILDRTVVFHVLAIHMGNNVN